MRTGLSARHCLWKGDMEGKGRGGKRRFLVIVLSILSFPFRKILTTKCQCRQQLHPGLTLTSVNSSFDQQSMEKTAGNAGRDHDPLHSMSERQDESWVGDEEILPPGTSFPGPEEEPQVAHAFAHCP